MQALLWTGNDQFLPAVPIPCGHSIVAHLMNRHADRIKPQGIDRCIGQDKCNGHVAFHHSSLWKEFQIHVEMDLIECQFFLLSLDPATEKEQTSRE